MWISFSCDMGGLVGMDAVGMGENLKAVGPGQCDQGDARGFGQRRPHRPSVPTRRSAPARPGPRNLLHHVDRDAAGQHHGTHGCDPRRAASSRTSLSSALWRPTSSRGDDPVIRRPERRRMDRARRVMQRAGPGKGGHRGADLRGRHAQVSTVAPAATRAALPPAVDPAQPAAHRPRHRPPPRRQPRLGLGRKPDLHVESAIRGHHLDALDLVRPRDALRSAKSRSRNPPVASGVAIITAWVVPL